MSKSTKQPAWGHHSALSFHDVQNIHDANEPAYLTLAAEAMLDGWTRDRVIAALAARIQRDERYLAYRKASGRHTSYDAQVQADMRASALAAVWLEESDPPHAPYA